MSGPFAWSQCTGLSSSNGFTFARTKLWRSSCPYFEPWCFDLCNTRCLKYSPLWQRNQNLDTWNKKGLSEYNLISKHSSNGHYSPFRSGNSSQGLILSFSRPRIHFHKPQTTQFCPSKAFAKTAFASCLWKTSPTILYNIISYFVASCHWLS